MYRLAIKLGCPNVEALGRSLTAKQLVDWETYAELEPFDETRDDYRTSLIATVIANVNRDPKKSAYKLEDFLLAFGDANGRMPEKKPQTWEEQEMIFKFLAADLAAAYRAR